MGNWESSEDSVLPSRLLQLGSLLFLTPWVQITQSVWEKRQRRRLSGGYRPGAWDANANECACSSAGGVRLVRIAVHNGRAGGAANAHQHIAIVCRSQHAENRPCDNVPKVTWNAAMISWVGALTAHRLSVRPWQTTVHFFHETFSKTAWRSSEPIPFGATRRDQQLAAEGANCPLPPYQGDGATRMAYNQGQVTLPGARLIIGRLKLKAQPAVSRDKGTRSLSLSELCPLPAPFAFCCNGAAVLHGSRGLAHGRFATTGCAVVENKTYRPAPRPCKHSLDASAAQASYKAPRAVAESLSRGGRS